MHLPAAFYRRGAVTVARDLLGVRLCTAAGSWRITETEAYVGEGDTACHARRGRTPRTAVMYLPGGAAYVYLCYGIHALLNIVTGEKDEPEAVLVRGVQGIPGPGRVTRAAGIDLSFNEENLLRSKRLWLEDDGTRFAYTAAPRVGIDYASERDRQRLWRFIAHE